MRYLARGVFVAGQCNDFFELMPGVCGEDLQLNSSVPTWVYKNVTLEVCQHLCIHKYTNPCSSVLYNSRTVTCAMVAFTAKNTKPNKEGNCFGRTQLFRRRRCIGE